jgi:RNA polymerase-binding transcription factor DksA
MTQVRTRLLSRHALVLARLQRDNRDALDLADTREADLLDEASTGETVSLLGHMVETQQRELQAINAALHRLASGTWGVCKACNGPIAARRLEAAPECNTCFACAEAGRLDHALAT